MIPGGTTSRLVRQVVTSWDSDEGLCQTTLEVAEATPFVVDLVITELPAGWQWRHGISRSRLSAVSVAAPLPHDAIPAVDAVELHVYPLQGGRLMFVTRPHRADRAAIPVSGATVADVLADSYREFPAGDVDEDAAWRALQPRWPWSRQFPGCDHACSCHRRNQPAAAI